MNVVHYCLTEKDLRCETPMCGYVGPGDKCSLLSSECTCVECLDWIRDPDEHSAPDAARASGSSK